jgi:glycosyltransferase involved in cell wall biosynthesis
MRKSRTILTVHDMRLLLSGSKLKTAVIKFFWFTMPSWRVRYITVISEFSKKELMRLTGIPAGRIRVVYDCVSPDLEPSPRAFNTARPVILNVGTTPNKNLHRVIPALEGMDVTLVIIGKLNDEQHELLKKHAIRFENYFNLPYEEVLEQFRRSDILLFASTYEGFGLPILEANSIGRPVITGNNTSLPEVAGDAALLVDADSVSAIREAVTRLISNAGLREQLVERGFENVKRFHPAMIGEQYARIYEELLRL